MAITFSFETPFTLKDRRRIKRWIQTIVSNHNKKAGDISYIFCDDEYLLTINKQYLDHDYYTDIITFDYVDGDCISGDLFISVERIKENAHNFEWDYKKEILRVIIHGVFHLLGYQDHSEQEEKTMRKLEDDALKLYFSDLNN